ncbi:MAG: hypothetical protein P8J32_06030, partial [bacterium]|nr:hypothetical protein [bacterium]
MANSHDRTDVSLVSLGSSPIIPVGIKFHLNGTQRQRLAALGVTDKGERSEDRQMQRRQEHVDHVGWDAYSQELRKNATGLRVGASGSNRIVFNKPEEILVNGEPEWLAARDTAGTLSGLRAQLIALGYTLVDMHLISRHGERRGMCDLTMFFVPAGTEGAVSIEISPELETALAAIEETYFRSIFVYDNKAAGNMFVVANHVVNKQTNQTGTLFEVRAPSVIKVTTKRGRLRWRHRPQKRRWVPHGIQSVVLEVNILPEDRAYLIGLGMTENSESPDSPAGDLLEVNENSRPNAGVLASDMIDPLCGNLGFRITEAKLLTGQD